MITPNPIGFKPGATAKVCEALHARKRDAFHDARARWQWHSREARKTTRASRYRLRLMALAALD